MVESLRHMRCKPRRSLITNSRQAKHQLPTCVRKLVQAQRMQHVAQVVRAAHQRQAPRKRQVARAAAAGAAGRRVGGQAALHTAGGACKPGAGQHRCDRTSHPSSPHLFFSSSCLRWLSAAASSATPASTLRSCAGKPLEVRCAAAAAASSSGACSVPPCCTATCTTAVSVSRLTAAPATPGCCSSMRFTAALQPPHFMPRTSSTTASVAGASAGGAGAGRAV